MKQYNEKHINDLSKSELEKLTSQGQLIDVYINQLTLRS